MATLAKIFIAAIFVLSNLFLGFTISAISTKDDNPKYKYMREKRLREVTQLDCKRLQSEIIAEEGQRDKAGNVQVVIKQLNDLIKDNKEQADQFDKQADEHAVKRDQQLEKLERIQVQVSNFTATMKAFREALASVERKYLTLQDSYQDTVRQFESMAVEKRRMQIEKDTLIYAHQAAEDVYFEAQREAAALTERVAAMVRENPDLPQILKQNGKNVDKGAVKSASEPPTGVVIITVGKDAGVTRGQQYSVFDAGTGAFKAKIQIVQVNTNTAVGMVEAPYQNVRINTNDTVRRSAIYLNRIREYESNR